MAEGVLAWVYGGTEYFYLVSWERKLKKTYVTLCRLGEAMEKVDEVIEEMKNEPGQNSKKKVAIELAEKEHQEVESSTLRSRNRINNSAGDLLDLIAEYRLDAPKKLVNFLDYRLSGIEQTCSNILDNLKN